MRKQFIIAMSLILLFSITFSGVFAETKPEYYTTEGMTVEKISGGYYLSGSVPADQVGVFVLNEEIDLDNSISFELNVKYNFPADLSQNNYRMAGFALNQGTPQQGSHLLEFASSAAWYSPYTANSGVFGMQVTASAYDTGLYGGQSTIRFSAQGLYQEASHWGAEINGVIGNSFNENRKLSTPLKDVQGRGNATKYTINSLPEEYEIIVEGYYGGSATYKVPKSRISPDGKYTQKPCLSIFFENYNASSFDEANRTMTYEATIKNLQNGIRNIFTADVDGEITVGQTAQVTVSKEENPDRQAVGTLSYDVEDDSIASVDENGLVTALSAGETKVIITAANGYCVEKNIKVLPSYNTVRITNPVSHIMEGETLQVQVSVNKSDYDDDSVEDTLAGLTYNSSNTDVATVDQSGLITVVGRGSFELTVTTARGVFDKKTFYVVTEPPLDYAVTEGFNVEYIDDGAYKVKGRLTSGNFVFVLDLPLELDSWIKFDLQARMDVSNLAFNNFADQTNRSFGFSINEGNIEDLSSFTASYFREFSETYPTGITRANFNKGMQLTFTGPGDSSWVQNGWGSGTLSYWNGTIKNLGTFTEGTPENFNSIIYALLNNIKINVNIRTDNANYYILMKSEQSQNAFALTVPRNLMGNNSDFAAKPRLAIIAHNDARTGSGSGYADETPYPAEIDFTLSNIMNGYVTKFTLDSYSGTLIKNGQQAETMQLEPIYENAELSFTYTSSDESVATVDANGLITAAGCGDAYITIESDEGYVVKYYVNVNDGEEPAVDYDGISPVQGGRQDEKILIPKPNVSDDSDCTLTAYVISPELYVLDEEDDDNFFIIPKGYGTYQILFEAVDQGGLKGAFVMQFDVIRAYDPIYDYYFGDTGEGYDDTVLCDIEDGVYVFGDIRHGRSRVIFNDDIKVDYDLSFDISIDFSNPDPDRYHTDIQYAILLNEAPRLRSGKLDYSYFYVMYTGWTGQNANGIQLYFRQLPEHRKDGKVLVEIFANGSRTQQGVLFLNDYDNGEDVARALTNGEKVLFKSYKDNENHQYVVTLQAYESDGSLKGQPCAIRFDNEWINASNGNLGFKTNPYLAIMTSAYNFDANWQEIPDGKYSRIDFKIENIHNTDVMGIYLDEDKGTLGPNQTYTLDVMTKLYKGKTLPEDFTLSFESSDESIATVNSQGMITVKDKFGTGKIIITSNYGDYAEYEITVTVTKLEFESERVEMKVGDVLKLNYIVEPEGVEVTWSTSNKNIATVDQDGNVTALAEGQVTIKIKVGTQEALCVITIQAKEEGGAGCGSCSGSVGAYSVISAILSLAVITLKLKKRSKA